jgi:trichohyalin
MINIKKQLLLLFVVFSYTNIFADERAPRSQCYINGGWALENTLESKIRELDVRLESLELYIRSDKKIYLTLGKIDRDEYRSYRSELGPAYSCSSGKGYLKRVSVDNNFKIANSLETNGRVIRGFSDLRSLLSPTLSSQIAAEEQKIEKEKIEKARLKKIQEQAIQVELEKQKRNKQENIKNQEVFKPKDNGKKEELRSSEANIDDSSWNIFALIALGAFFISWCYIKIKAANKKKKLAEQEAKRKKQAEAEAERKKQEAEEKAEQRKKEIAERKKKEDEAARQFNETLKKFESDYPNIEYTKLEMECIKYLKTGLEEERSEILVNLKELEIKEKKQAEVEAERKKQDAEAEAERKKQAAEAAAERRKIEKAKLKKKLAEAEAERKKQAALALARYQEKIKLLTDKYGEKVAKAFDSKRVEIGMPISYVNDLKGSGHDRKRSVSKEGESIKEKYGKYFKELSGGKKSSNPSYKMEIEYERSEDGSSWLVSSYKDY